MVKIEKLSVLEEKMELLNPDKDTMCKLLACEQGDKIDAKSLEFKRKSEREQHK